MSDSLVLAITLGLFGLGAVAIYGFIWHAVGRPLPPPRRDLARPPGASWEPAPLAVPPTQRRCPGCGMTHFRHHAMTDDRCDVCQVKAFDAETERMREFWDAQGWKREEQVQALKLVQRREADPVELVDDDDDKGSAA